MPDARFQPLPGFRDFAPVECSLRNYLFNTWRRVATRYGFTEWEGPTVEATDLYLKKSGGELPTQLFRFTDQGNRDITMRPELTASLGRIAAAYQREYTKPLKWFEIGSCFRYEKPQKGRLREFYQFNADILGEETTNADAELIALAIDCMLEFGFTQQDFVVRVSDRQAWLDFAAARHIPEQNIPAFLAVVDKLERDRPEECQRKLDRFHLNRNDLLTFIQNPPSGASPRIAELLQDLRARGLDSYVKQDLSVVRGLAYYTGIVFEIFDSQHSLRAIAGGGRYDSLVAALSNNAVNMPATGFAMGDAVITHLIEQTPHAKAKKDQALASCGCQVALIQATPEARPALLALAATLRNNGLNVDLPLTLTKINGQLQKAVKAGAKTAIIVGADFPQVELRNLATREYLHLNASDLLQHLSAIISNK